MNARSDHGMRPGPPPPREQARRFYDRLGSRQDWQRFYEDPALAELVRHAAFERTRAVFELGCGTGRVAERLLAEHLPPQARYVGVDLSATMVQLARTRLARFGGRATVHHTGGELAFEQPSGAFDRFLSTYVLDLLDETDIQSALLEAHRLLAAGGSMCLVSLTHGTTPASRLVERLWAAVHRWRPLLLGGCRPISLRELTDPDRWRVRHHQRITRFGIASEILVAERIGGPPELGGAG